MKKSNVYTRGGDKGETSLVSGNRIPKSDKRINLYGDVDELNSNIGYFLCLLKREEGDFSADIILLEKIQSALFDLGSRLACEKEKWEKYKLPSIQTDLISMMEKQIDILDSELPKMKFFILPGGSPAGAYSHVARTICRRVERELVEFNQVEAGAPDNSLELMNRLSDYLFVLGRYVNFKLGINEAPWQPQAE